MIVKNLLQKMTSQPGIEPATFRLSAAGVLQLVNSITEACDDIYRNNQ